MPQTPLPSVLQCRPTSLAVTLVGAPTTVTASVQTHVLVTHNPDTRPYRVRLTYGENNSLYRASYGVYLWREQLVQSSLRNQPVERTTPRVSYVYLLTELPVQSNLMYVNVLTELPVQSNLMYVYVLTELPVQSNLMYVNVLTERQ